MNEIIACFVLVVIENLVSCQVQEATQTSDPQQTSTRDPYANVLSQLSDVIFDVEDRLYRLTAPKYESENSKLPQGEDKNNRRRNYFDQIRDNYKTLQDQLGQSLSSGGLARMPDILNLNFQNKGTRSSLDLSLPFLPLNIKVDAKKPPTKETGEQAGTEQLKMLSPFSDVNSNINLGLGGIFGQEAPTHAVDSLKNIKPELQKRSSRPIRSASAANKNPDNKAKSSIELFGDSPKANVEQLTGQEESSGVEGRILGDLLFSESSFDKYFRKFLNDHGKWLLDSNTALPPKKIIESIRDVTRNQFTSIPPKSKTRKEKSGVSGKKEASHHISGNKKETSHHGHHQSGTWKHDTEARIVLAFTPEGLPLKLKIDPSVNKPLKFLHKILSEGRVSLNIPVSSTNGMQPVGDGVLQLGFDDSGSSSHTPLLDLSDNNQLNYLLRTLKKLKHGHH